MRAVAVVCFCVIAALAGWSGKARAETCPANPDALGTSRVLSIGPSDFSRIGSMQYKQALPLKDHEVVITFDDGPLPPYSNIILDTLASQCVKVTYFIVGEMAHAYPSVLRRMYNEGHTIGTHSLDHPLGFERMGLQGVEHEVDGGIALVDAAIGDPKAVSPFFRIPGLGRSKVDESYLASKSLVTWSADVVADDWFRGITPQQIVQRAMRRLEEKGRGILLLHDIHPATAMALPSLLKQLKAKGFHVVHVVPAEEQPKSVPVLVATPAQEKGAWPRVVHASAKHMIRSAGKIAGKHTIKSASAADTASSRHDKASLRHRVRALITGKHRPATLASARQVDYYALNRDRQLR
jgi:peptidoglycan/xylan/chitin deacetylase (PgdA/CDA1 family)